MLVTNTTAQDYWFGPLHLLGGNGQTLTVDDTTATSLYLTDDAVADAINNLYISGKITVSSAAAPFPRPTGVPSLLHGDGSPEGLVYAPQGSVYLRRDGTGANSLYTKTTGVTLNTGWENYTTTAVGPGTTYRKTTVKDVVNTITETDLTNGEIVIGAGVLGTTGIARVSAWGDLEYDAAGIPRFKLKLGATTLIDTNIPSSFIVASTTRQRWRLDATIANAGAANAQVVDFLLAFTGGAGFTNTHTAFTTGEGNWWAANEAGSGQGYMGFAGGFNTAAVDTTVAQALAFTLTWGAASANLDLKLYGALVEII